MRQERTVKSIWWIKINESCSSKEKKNGLNHLNSQWLNNYGESNDEREKERKKERNEERKGERWKNGRKEVMDEGKV